MPETAGEMPVFGPNRPTLFALRGIRFLEGEDGASAGEPQDETEGADESAELGENNDEQEDPAATLKKALKAEREARRAAERERNTLKQQLEVKDKPAEEAALEAARREATEAVTAKANARIVKAELRAAASAKVSNLTALTRLVDTDAIDVDEDGNPSADDIEDAIKQFLTDYPEFAVDKSKFPGTADQGSKGKRSAPAQLTRDDLQNMTPEEIDKARKEGRLDKILGVSK